MKANQEKEKAQAEEMRKKVTQRLGETKKKLSEEGESSTTRRKRGKGCRNYKTTEKG